MNGQRYTLVDSGSLMSSSTCFTEEDDGEFPHRGFTQSLPAEIERKISVGSKEPQPAKVKKKEVDCFSDNFVAASQDSEVVS